MVRFFRKNVNDFGFLCNDLILPRWHSTEPSGVETPVGRGRGLIPWDCAQRLPPRVLASRQTQPARWARRRHGASSAMQPWQGPGTQSVLLGRGHGHWLSRLHICHPQPQRRGPSPSEETGCPAPAG